MPDSTTARPPRRVISRCSTRERSSARCRDVCLQLGARCLHIRLGRDLIMDGVEDDRGDSLRLAALDAGILDAFARVRRSLITSRIWRAVIVQINMPEQRIRVLPEFADQRAGPTPLDQPLPRA